MRPKQLLCEARPAATGLPSAAIRAYLPAAASWPRCWPATYLGSTPVGPAADRPQNQPQTNEHKRVPVGSHRRCGGLNRIPAALASPPIPCLMRRSGRSPAATFDAAMLALRALHRCRCGGPGFAGLKTRLLALIAAQELDPPTYIHPFAAHLCFMFHTAALRRRPAAQPPPVALLLLALHQPLPLCDPSSRLCALQCRTVCTACNQICIRSRQKMGG